MKIEDSLSVAVGVALWQFRFIPGELSFAHLFSFPCINLITVLTLVTRRGEENRREVCKGCRPRENVIWIRSYESNRNSAERTRHRLEIRFEFAGGDGVELAS